MAKGRIGSRTEDRQKLVKDHSEYVAEVSRFPLYFRFVVVSRHHEGIKLRPLIARAAISAVFLNRRFRPRRVIREIEIGGRYILTLRPVVFYGREL